MESEVIDKCRNAQAEGRAAASKDAWLPSLFNLKWMLSCLATRSVTLRYGGGGGWAQRHNAVLCLRRTASCGMILAHMHSPPPSSAMDGGSLLWPHIFHFSTWKAPPVDLVVKSPFPLWHKKKKEKKGESSFSSNGPVLHMKRQRIKAQPLREDKIPTYCPKLKLT